MRLYSFYRRAKFPLSLAALLAGTGVALAEGKPTNLCGKKFSDVEEVRQFVAESLPESQISEVQGLETYADKKRKILWTFTQEGQVGHPSAMCRKVKGNKADLAVLCKADQESCAALYRVAANLLRQMRGKFPDVK